MVKKGKAFKKYKVDLSQYDMLQVNFEENSVSK